MRCEEIVPSPDALDQFSLTQQQGNRHQTFVIVRMMTLPPGQIADNLQSHRNAMDCLQHEPITCSSLAEDDATPAFQTRVDSHSMDHSHLPSNPAVSSFSATHLTYGLSPSKRASEIAPLALAFLLGASWSDHFARQPQGLLRQKHCAKVETCIRDRLVGPFMRCYLGDVVLYRFDVLLHWPVRRPSCLRRWLT